ncbi:MAG: DoxX family protein [Nocardioides sp.]|uniref:DoxX family protein n=1 Tax=Nocardioides sp. TaxID=35761 RepID=UPI0039E4E928
MADGFFTTALTGVDVGLLLLRVGVAVLLVGHATQKLFGWFSGAGPAGTGAMFETWGFRPGPLMAVMAGSSELTAAASLALGLLTVAGCVVLIGTMLVACAPNAGKGVWAHMGGFEVPLLYAGAAIVIVFTGPGSYSLDHWLLDATRPTPALALTAVVVGGLAAAPLLLRRRAVLHANTT